MSSNFLKIMFIFLSIFILPVYGKNIKRDIFCPTLGMIQKNAMKVDTSSEINKNNYTVWTAKTVIHHEDYDWSIAISSVTASSTTDAIKIAKELISVAQLQHNEYALRNAVLLICGYGPGEIVAVAHLQ